MNFRNVILETVTNGGGTFSSAGYTVNQSNGFVVGGRVPTVKMPIEAISGEDIVSFVARYALATFGTWVKDDVVYLDAIDVIDNKAQALTLARQRREYAIYDLKNACDIIVSPFVVFARINDRVVRTRYADSYTAIKSAQKTIFQHPTIDYCCVLLDRPDGYDKIWEIDA